MDSGTEIEDIFEDGLLSVFGDVKVSHGAPGQVFCYPTQTHGTLKLHIVSTSTFEERVQLFAHFVWNAAVHTADLISTGEFTVLGESVLELGAGAGLPGILAILQGAKSVVLSDYNSPQVLQNLERNVEENVPPTLRRAIKVEGHTWGENDCSILQDRVRFSRIIAADCLWMNHQHRALVASLSLFLERSVSSRIFLVAGLHTGRAVLSLFFQVAAASGLVPDEYGIFEHSVITGGQRTWKEERGFEDSIERKQWLVVTRLKWGTEYVLQNAGKVEDDELRLDGEEAGVLEAGAQDIGVVASTS